MKRDILVVGYYGHNNFGDDILASYVLTKVLEVIPPERVVVSSPNPYLERWFPGIKCVRPWEELWSLPKKAVFGGGGIFGSVRQLLYYRRILSFQDWRRVEKYAFCVGVDSARNSISKWLVGKFLRFFKEISVRDIRSKMALSIMGIHSRLVVDPSVGYFRNASRGPRTSQNPLSVGIIIRNHPPNYVAGPNIEFISLQKEYPSVRTWNPEEETVEEFYDYLSQFDLLITERMHGVYLGALLDIPTIAVDVSSKMRSAIEVCAFRDSWEAELKLLDAEARRLQQWLEE